MLIERVDVFDFPLTYVHGEYVMSGGRVISTLPSTLVRVTTDDGVTGWGEVCPLGTTYLAAHAEGARAALALLAPAVVGLDATNLAAVNAAMDRALAGHEYAKSPIDVACWDVLGRALGVSVTTLLGGLRQESFPLYVAVPLRSPDGDDRLRARPARRRDPPLPAQDRRRSRRGRRCAPVRWSRRPATTTSSSPMPTADGGSTLRSPRPD